MTHTITETPVVRTIARWWGKGILRLLGWRTEGEPPSVSKYVLVCAHHTSSWDFPLTLAVAFAMNLPIRWIGKKSMFPWPVRGVLEWLGGIPVDRDHAGGLIPIVVHQFEISQRMALAIAPEGTRSKVSRWKRGFYVIANEARVPMIPAYLDYSRKVAGFGPALYPSGDIDADVAVFRAFFDSVTPRHPDMAGDVRV